MRVAIGAEGAPAAASVEPSTFPDFDAPELTEEFLNSPERRQDPEFQAMLSAWRALADEVAGARPRLLEGLAHPFWKKAQFRRQVRAGGHVRIDGSYFFAQPVQLSRESADRLWSLLGSPEGAATFRPEFGKKGCGGFHADWVVTWHRGRVVMHAQICFTCSLIVVTKGNEPKPVLETDLSAAGHRALLEVLYPYYRRTPVKDRKSPND